MLDTPLVITGGARVKRRAVALNTSSGVGIKSSHLSAPSSNHIEENRLASTTCMYLMRTSQRRQKVKAGFLGAVLGVSLRIKLIRKSSLLRLMRSSGERDTIDDRRTTDDQRTTDDGQTVID